VEHRAAAALWEQVAEKTQIPWPQEQPDRQPQWYDLDRLRLLYGRPFEQKDWQHVLDCYGDARMLALPLDAWPGALDEMVALIEQGVLVRWRQQLAVLKRRVLSAFLDAIDHGVKEVFRRTFQEPVCAMPHLASQALLGRIRNHLEESRGRLEEVEARERPVLPDPTELRAHAESAQHEFEKGLAAVPSPAAVMLRLAPLFAFCLGLVLALPFDLGLINSAPQQLGVGAVAGACGAGYLYLRHLDGSQAPHLGSGTCLDGAVQGGPRKSTNRGTRGRGPSGRRIRGIWRSVLVVPHPPILQAYHCSPSAEQTAQPSAQHHCPAHPENNSTPPLVLYNLG
jgi:hypothetical protein